MRMRLQTEFMLKTHEVTPEVYEEMLGVLPPERMTTNGFLVGEPTDHKGPGGDARFQLYFEEDGKFYDGGLATVVDFGLFNVPAI